MHYIVISRFEERLDPVVETWSRDPGISVIVYTKGTSPAPGDIALPNVGREAHTFAQACLDLYDRLETGDAITFLQAGFLDHVDLDSVSTIFRTPITSVAYHASHIAPSDLDGRPHHRGLCLAPAKQRLESIFDIRLPETFVFAAGAQYTVPAPRIHQYSKQQWNQLSGILGLEYVHGQHTHDGIDPWQMERFWPSLFDSH